MCTDLTHLFMQITYWGLKNAPPKTESAKRESAAKRQHQLLVCMSSIPTDLTETRGPPDRANQKRTTGNDDFATTSKKGKHLFNAHTYSFVRL